MMFLPPDKWSPRYEQQFYTVEMNKYTKLDKDPTTDNNDTCQIFCGKPKFPAIYYTIDIFCGTSKHTCQRRYSQFLTLCNKIDRDGKLGTRSKLPAKTGPFHRDTGGFIEERMEALCAFLKEVLTQQEAVGNSAVEWFLELDVWEDKSKVVEK